METINVEEFKRNIKACLDQLPFAVTRRGKVLFTCYGPEGKPVDVPEKVKKQECNDMPALPKSPVASNSEVEKPAKTPEISKAPETSGVYFHPMPKAGNSKQHKATGKLSAKPVDPVVSAMLLTIKASPTASHHPCCTCGICKPVISKA